MVKKKYYKYWGYTYEYKPSYFEMGLWMFIVVVTFPIWIWFYLLYQIFKNIGKLNGKPRVVEVDEQEETYY